jgi:uncharacterized protein YjiK
MISQSENFRVKCSGMINCTGRISLFLAVIISVSFCKSSESIQSAGSIPYDLDKPDKRYVMPGSLKEISGIEFFKEDKILCIQDEKGIIYEFNTEKNKITNKFEFANGGDYEDIAISGQTAYVVRSDGAIFAVSNFDKGSGDLKVYKTHLSRENNCEGVAYDKISNSLFISCKGSPSVRKEKPFRGYKAIYQFDQETKKLNKEPLYLIDLGKPDCYKSEIVFNAYTQRAAEELKRGESEPVPEPSGIAIHPVSDEIYLLYNVGKILIVMDRQGKILAWKALDKDLFRQPEGICFSPSGDLFISNEGRGEDGYILKFKIQKSG